MQNDLESAKPNANPELLNRAREMRHAQTEAEQLIWTKLRNRRFGKFKFRRQVPIGRFIADFVCFERRLIIELDGGPHTDQKEYDSKRSAWLAEQGFRVVRVWNHEVWESAEVLEELIWRELHREVK